MHLAGRALAVNRIQADGRRGTEMTQRWLVLSDAPATGKATVHGGGLMRRDGDIQTGACVMTMFYGVVGEQLEMSSAGKRRRGRRGQGERTREREEGIAWLKRCRMIRWAGGLRFLAWEQLLWTCVVWSTRSGRGRLMGSPALPPRA